MCLKKTTLLAIICLGISFAGFSQRAKDGDFTTTGPNTIVNTYTYLTANATAGTASITVDDNTMAGAQFGGNLVAGDLILIIQMQGASMNNDPQFSPAYSVPNGFTWFVNWFDHAEVWGSLTTTGWGGYNNSGKFEQVEVMSVSGGNTINLQCALQNNYTQSGHVQIVRIPRFNNLTVDDGPQSIVPATWNGQTGGIVAIEVEQVLDINAGSSISASDEGFRGGQVDNVGQSGDPSNTTGVTFLGSDNAIEGSEKGEGIFGFYTEYDAIWARYGIAAATNGGGGGGYQNAGGGGGSNVYTGALRYTGTGVPDQGAGGIYTPAWNLDISFPPDPNLDILNPPTEHLLMTPIGTNLSPGGGRGGYSLSDGFGTPNPLVVGPRNSSWNGDARKSNGGLGGHALQYDATRIFFGGGGGAGDQDSGQGGSGGRGGGLVFISNYGSVTGAGTIEANGEAGGSTGPAQGNDGAGGGGAGGWIHIENATALPASIQLSATGGDGGDMIHQTLGFVPDEADGPGGSGAGGAIAFNSGAPTQNVVAGSNGVVSTDHPTQMMVNFPPNGATNGFVGESGLSAPFYDIIAVNDTICIGETANLTVSTVGSVPGTIEWYTQQFGGTPIVGQSGQLSYSPTPVVTTTYYVGVCPGTFRVEITVVVNPAANLVITDPAAVCAPATVDITALAVTVGSDPGTLTYWFDNTATTSMAGAETAVSTSGWYYIQLDAGGCLVLDSVLVTINPAEDATFTLTPTCVGGTASVSGTPGGTFTFNPAPGDGAVINPSTGAVTNGTIGTTYFVEYTTPGTCSVSLIQSVIAASDLAYIPTITDENCGAGDGIIDLVASGGDGGPYQYSITGGAPYSPAPGNFTGLGANTYNISILDNSGCEVTGTESVSSSGGPSIDNVVVSEPTCAGACDGTITLTVSGGTAPYSYQWYDDLSNPIGPDNIVITGLCAGDYSVEVTDAAGLIVYFNEDFGTDVVSCTSQGTLANAYDSGAGAWSVSLTGPNDPDANLWFVSTMEEGVGSGNCGTGCGAIPAGPGISRTLHLSNPVIPLFGIAADQGAAYNAGGGCPGFFCVITDARAESPAINLAGTNMNLTFDYLHEGDGTDQCELMYFDGAIWNSLGVLPNTGVGPCAGGQHLWAQYSWPVPAVLNGLPNFQLGFRWTNDDGTGTDPSVAIDNIVISEVSVTCPAIANATLTDPAAVVLVTTDPAAICAPSTVDLTAPAVTVGSDAGALTYWFDNTATTSMAGAETAVSTSGWYFIQLDVAGCTVLDSVQVTINPLDDASFTSADFCASTVNTISGVATLGGTYAITAQTGSGLATINASTGVLANFVAGDQVTIEYTTPAGGCPNSSTQVVNVLPLDDASFTSVDFCASTVNTISGVAIPGGTYVITAQTGSGLVTINGSTGILANYVAGDQVTIEYTTPAGGCQNSSTQVVNVTALDDASFTSVDFCASTVNTISGVATPGGTYAITAQTGSGLATINGSTGVLANYVAGDQVTIEYTTPAGGCQNTSTQVVNVLPLDDASFTSVDFCASTVNTISGVAIPGGAFAITAQTGSGLATINPLTGVLANFVAGDQITIGYLTPAGGCQNGSTQVVNVLPLDDASFTSVDFCASTVNTISGVAIPGGTYVITAQTGSGLVTINGATGVLANYVAGDQVTIEYTTPAGGCQNSSTQVVNVTALDDASFTSVDFCASSVNTISGVAILGGTYAITAQTGSGLVTINGATGVLANYVAGDQVTIEYTTPAGGCQNSSTQVVNVTALDDASFTSVDFCASAVNIISGVVTPGGTYAITAQTGSGLATINGTTGVLANYVAGDQVTIEYTTPAGGCQNSSTQVVNVIALDDASFTSVDFCASTVNTISGVATAGGTYTITAQTGSGLATINGATGVLANYVAGDQVTIEYTTPAGGCQNTSTQVVNVTALDDASFTSADFCASTVNTISGVAIPGGTYVITAQTGSGLATINGATGVLANFVAGDQVTIEYTTPAGGCQNTSTQVVNVTALDDASFTSVDFCASTVNIISGVALPGGTYAITAQTGSGLATINGATGVLANYVAGDQVTIEYTTPAGGCQNTSTQVVNVTALDDASFTSVDFCASTVNTISGVAIPGGTYVITAQTGSGLVTINGATGVLANYVAGDQVTIEYTTPAGGCQNTSTQVVNVTALDDASFTSTDFCESTVNTISGVATVGGTYTITAQTGSGLATVNGATGVLANFVAGDQVTIEYTTPAGGCQNTSTQVVNVTALDDASFTSVDFCASTVNTISGVAIPGGAYVITAQTGSGLVTINGATGVLANFVAGDQVTIEYTTPAGGCQNTSTQVVNVTALDDASFTSVDFCESTVNTISGVAIPGGTYIITAQTGSGLVTINGATGVLANYVAGDQVTIEYTTPAGGCQNTSTQVVNVTALDDASFTSTDFCESTVNTISGVALPGGTYTISAQTGSGLATINGATGVLANYVAGDQVTIEYTTPAGGCQNTSTQVVNVTALDDASFTSADFCESTVNTISGVALPGGTYTITAQTGSGLATINGATGVLANFVAGDQVTIEYTTPAGGCQNTSTQIVNVTALDDASFTSFDFCASSVNVISGVAVPGGTYVITAQTGSGLVTINGSTGVLANFVTGDQITIEYTTPAGGCQNTSTQVVNVTSLDDASFISTDFCESTVNTIGGVATAGGTYAITAQTGSGLVTINASTGVLANFVAGDQVTIEYTTPAGGCQNTSTQIVNVTALDDASFTSADFCESTVNTISGVALPGGTYTISAQTGSGLVTINGATGVLANFVAGDQVTIEYTTPAGGCQNTSTQIVNVTALDDASFTSADFCASSVNVISGVAIPGGTYVITAQTGSGLVTINGATGVLANYVAGDQVTIEYTTPAGGCQNTSTQVVNVTTQDDATFASVDFCESTVNTVSGIATPGGTFTITAQTGSGLVTIDAATGVLANYVAGDQVTIEYTTPAGACQSTSTQIVNVLPSDDATFVMTATCDGGTSLVSGTVGGTFTFTTSPTDGATIDGATGTVSGGTSGTSYDVTYTTTGACPASSSQTVVALAIDDASFTMSGTCDGGTATVTGTSGGSFTFDIAPTDAATIDPATGAITGGTENTTYTVMYTTAGLCPNSSVESVTSSDCSIDPDVIIPTAFTPDSDGANDGWEILNLDNIYPNSIVRVYNRWGSLLYEHEASAANPYSLSQWDGTYNGAVLPVASYYFIIDYNDGSTEQSSGTVSIILND
ncbi:MAG: gliding motility-associated C-terminal domain-containing protein [Crocinitomicaceae bacterium]|nr:gliding motility-associated C-terminal domain-containing protein [Crocinitomicaceae bacterium]